MKIESLEKEVLELKRKLAEQSGYQIQTEKDIVRINEKLDTILEAICELKDRRRVTKA